MVVTWKTDFMSIYPIYVDPTERDTADVFANLLLVGVETRLPYTAYK